MSTDARRGRSTIAELAIDFDLSLTAQSKSPATRRVYGTAVRHFGEFSAARGMPTEAVGIAREHVEAYLADLFAQGRSASTAKTRSGGLKCLPVAGRQGGDHSLAHGAHEATARARPARRRARPTTPCVAWLAVRNA